MPQGKPWRSNTWAQHIHLNSFRIQNSLLRCIQWEKIYNHLMIFPCHKKLENSILQSLRSTKINTSWTIQHPETYFTSFNYMMTKDLEDFTWHHTTRTPHVCKFRHKLRTLEKPNRKYKTEILTYQWFILTQVTWLKLLVKEITGSRWERNLRIRLQLRWTCQKKVPQESGNKFCWSVSVPERRRNTEEQKRRSSTSRCHPWREQQGDT